MTIGFTKGFVPRRRDLLTITGAAALGAAFSSRRAHAADKVIFRTNWLFYGSHAIFFLGIDKGFYGKDNLDVVVKQGNGSGNTCAWSPTRTPLRLLLGGDHDEPRGPGRAGHVGRHHRCHGHRCGDRQSGFRHQDLQGSRGQEGADHGRRRREHAVPGRAPRMPVSMSTRSSSTNVAESALVPSYLQGLAPAMLGGIDDKPAEIEANGGKTPIAFNLSPITAWPSPAMPSSPIRTRSRTIPTWCKRFVHARWLGEGGPGQSRRRDRSRDQLEGQHAEDERRRCRPARCST